MAIVHITRGTYLNEEISGSFQLVREWQPTTTGQPINGFDGTVRVFHESLSKNIQVRCNESEIKVVSDNGDIASDADNTGSDPIAEYYALESEDDAVQRIRETFELAERAAKGVKRGSIRGLIISGPAGIGKSYTIMEMLTEGNMMAESGSHRGWEVVKGWITPVSLYKKFYEYREKGDILVFDDTDCVWDNEASLNLMKAALDSSERRTLHWASESAALRAEDVPNSFDFEGSVIFITNRDFRKATPKLQPHYDAMRSRCHYLDLEMSRSSDLFLRIKQIVGDGMLDSYRFDQNQITDIIDFVRENIHDLEELSLRMVKKIADAVQADPADWRPLVEATCTRPEARFRRLLAEKKRQIEEMS